MSKLVAAAALLALVVPSAQAQPQHHGRPGCRKLYTVAMGTRAARAVYAGTRNVTITELRMLGRIEACQRYMPSTGFVRWYDHHRHHLWWLRRHPPAPTWAIPYPIVQCESGGQNLPPNGAGASGYYQIIPGTWAAYGGSAYAPEAYQASKAKQGIVAARIWAQGGPSQWVCAGLTAW